MTAHSVTGKGPGSSNKPTSKELAMLANGPAILIAGTAEINGGITSPPSSSNNTIVFPKALPGGSENYVVILTTLNGGYVYISDLDEDADGNFSGFSAIAESECTLMYMVSKVGVRPTV